MYILQGVPNAEQMDILQGGQKKISQITERKKCNQCYL